MTRQEKMLAFICLAALIGCDNSPETNGTTSIVNQESNCIEYQPGPYEEISSDGRFVLKNANHILDDLKSVDASIVLRAAEAIPFRPEIEYWPAISDLTGLLQTDNEQLKIAAVNAISGIAASSAHVDTRLPELDRALDPLIEILSHSDSVELRRSVVFAIENSAKNLGKVAIRRMVPVLIIAVRDPSEDVGVVAMDAIGSFGAESKTALPTLFEQLEASDRRALLAAGSIGEICMEPERSVPALIEALNKSDFIRNSVVEALGKFGPDSRDAVPQLIEILEKSDAWRLREDAVISLGKIGKAAAPAIPSLVKEYQNNGYSSLEKNKKMRVLSALCLTGKVGKNTAVTLVKELTEFGIHDVENPVDLLDVLANSPRLVRLNLSGSNLNDEQLIHLSSMEQLEELMLPHYTTDKGLAYISNLTNLRLIYHHGTTDESQGAKAITNAGLVELQPLRNLRTLTLINSAINDKGLGQLDHFSFLTTLHLGNSDISDDGMLRLSCLKNLKELSLRGTDVGDAGAATLAAHCPNLEKLNLCFTQVTSASVPELSKMKKMRWLGVYETPLSKDETVNPSSIVVLRRLLPDCEIMWLD